MGFQNSCISIDSTFCKQQECWQRPRRKIEKKIERKRGKKPNEENGIVGLILVFCFDEVNEQENLVDLQTNWDVVSSKIQRQIQLKGKKYHGRIYTFFLSDDRKILLKEEQIRKEENKEGLTGLGPNKKERKTAKCNKNTEKIGAKTHNQSKTTKKYPLELKDTCDRATNAIFSKIVCHPICWMTNLSKGHLKAPFRLIRVPTDSEKT